MPVVDFAPGYAEQGLLNGGRENCFLNAIIQVLWHIQPLHEYFLHPSAHICEARRCVHCATVNLFKAHITARTVPLLDPAPLRTALHASYAPAGRFILDRADDVADAFDAILSDLHNAGSGLSGPSLACTADSPCISHAVFGHRTLSAFRCDRCGAGDLDYPDTRYTFQCNARFMYKYPPTLSNHPFEDALRAAAMGTDNYCPECGNPTHHTRRFARIPHLHHPD